MIARETIRAVCAALVQRFGCLDAAAETINARMGSATTKGTLSRKIAGYLDFTVAEIVALEDAMGAWPVTRILARRSASGGAEMAGGTLVGQGGLIAKEAGEAVSAIVAADQSADAGDRATAIVEIGEAIDALEAARAHLQKGGGA